MQQITIAREIKNNFAISPIKQQLFLEKIKKIIPFLLRLTPWVLFFFCCKNILNQIISPELPIINPDSGTYEQIAKHILNYQLPDLGVRPFFYPLFLSVTKFFSQAGTLESHYVVLFQSGLCLLSSLSLIYAVYKWSSFLASLAVVILYLYVFKNHSIMVYNASLLSDSLLCSLLFFFVSLLILCLHVKNRPFHWFLLSLIMALAIFTKPVAQFLLPIFFILLIYLLYSSRLCLWSRMLSFCLPIQTLLLGMIVYNYWVGGFIGLSNFGSYNLLGASCYGLPFIDKFPSPGMQDAASKVRSNFQEQGVLELLANSWKRNKLSAVYENNYNTCLNIEGASLLLDKDKILGKHNNITAPMWREYATYYMTIAKYTILHAPKMYFKFVFTGLRSYINQVFSNTKHPYLWEVAFLWIALHSGWSFLRSKGKSSISFLLSCLVVYFVTYGVVICLVEPPLERYVYNIVYLPFLTIILYPLLFVYAHDS